MTSRCVALVVLAAGAALALPPPAAPAEVVTRDTAAGAVWAIGDTLLYGRDSEDRGWMRIVGGRRSEAHLPEAAAVQSFGRDARGRVVAILYDEGGSRVYDVAADHVRKVRLRPRSGCRFPFFAMWRGRVAYAAYCGGGAYDVFLREGGRETRVGRISHDSGGPTLLLRGRSLVADGIAGDETHRLWGVLDRGRRCFGVADLLDAHDEWKRRAMGVAGGEALWVVSQAEYPPDGSYATGDLTVMSARLDGVCGDGPEQRLVALDVTGATVRGVALDRRTLYYTTAEAIHRIALPRKTTAAPPGNDDVAGAQEITVPGETVGRIGHATLEPGESELHTSGRTVWFRFRADRSRRLVFALWGALGFRIYAGEREIATAPRVGFDTSVDVVAGTEYRIQVASWAGPYATYQPFHLLVRDG